MELLMGLLQNLVWAILAFIVGYVVNLRKLKRLQRMVQSFEIERASREVVLILSCREDIEVAVRQQFAGLGIKPQEVFKVHRDGIFSDNENDWMAYVRQVRDRVRDIRSFGATRVHFFTNAPVAMAAFAGALLDNGPQVYVYHYFGGVYRRVGILSHETVNLP